jgi:molecular chaperone GrpE
MPVDNREIRDASETGEQGEMEPSPAEVVEEECKELKELLAKKEEELKQAQDRILRLAADFDNTRKRLEKDRSEGISYANENIMRALIPVIDNLERAIEHGEKDEICQVLIEGIRLTLKSFLEVFSKFGGNQFESIGQQFDPNKHEAVTQEQTSEHPDMTVTREFQKGYTLRERLLRPAMVAVARNSKNQ